MEGIEQAANYDLFEERHAMRGAFESNESKHQSLQDTIRLEEFTQPSIIRPVIFDSLFRGNDDFHLKPLRLKEEDNLTHWYYEDGTPIPLVPMSMGELRSNADLDRTNGVYIGDTSTLQHTFVDTFFTRDNKYGQ